jgi:acyl-CoA reductase-like NAD-dependent aldehyde dehydrogenase
MSDGITLQDIACLSALASGWGREKGPYGLDLFTQIKSVVVNYT